MNPKDCSSIFALLSEYLDRELPPGDCEELERHIQACEPCVAFVDSLKKSIAVGETYAPAEAAPPLAPDTRRALQDAYARMLTERAQKSPAPPTRRTAGD